MLPGVARCSLLSAATRSLSESPGERQSFAFCHFVCSTGIAEATRTPKARRLQHVALGDLEDTQGLCSTSQTHGADPQRKLCFDFQQQGLAEGSQEKQLPPLHPLSSAEEGKQKKEMGRGDGGTKALCSCPTGAIPKPLFPGPISSRRSHPGCCSTRCARRSLPQDRNLSKRCLKSGEAPVQQHDSSLLVSSS